MSTSIKHVHITTKQQRLLIRKRNRTIRMILFFAMLCIIIVMSICYISRGQALKDLENQVQVLTDQVMQLERDNYTLGSELTEKERTLGMLLDDNEIRVADPAIYNIPLDAALQEYTYNLCVDYCIAEHYELVLAVMWQESNFDAEVISSTGDYGLMQINEVNHGWLSEDLGVDDILDEHQNIHAGVYIMAKLIHKYGSTSKALMAYNMGERGAASYWAIGTYSTAYSDSVMAKRAAIESDSYSAK